MALFAGVATAGAAESRTWQFDFGTGPVASGCQSVTPQSVYSDEAGFGLENPPALTSWQGKGNDPLLSDGISAERPFLFSAAVPPGIYDVSVTFGNPTESTELTVKAEARRLIFHQASVEGGKQQTRTFTVAVKSRANADGKLWIKPSQPATNWDGKLTLEFNGKNPSISAVKIAPAEKAVGIFIAGDSTVTDQGGALYTGWGQMLPAFFKSGAYVYNNAQSGDSLGSFKNNGLFTMMLNTAQPGDYLLVQFGHNDQKAKRRKGVDPLTAYRSNLREYVALGREKKLNVVLISPMERRRFKDGVATPTLRSYADTVREVAQEEKVPFIDLNAESIRLYNTLGEGKSKKLFLHYGAGAAPDGRSEALSDNTHFDNYGGYELARIVATGIHKLKLDVSDFLTDDFVPFDPDQPDDIEKLALPLSPLRQDTAKPEGS
ncbi:MAG: rhamnogalacturonan acetylesterase [Luteolibacter sp.]